MRNIFEKTPLHMYLEKIKCPVSVVLEILIQDEVEYCDIHQMNGLELTYEVMGVILALNGRSI